MAVPAQLLVEAFEARFQSTPDLFRAPGRVNLIGEHTDYNLGFVLPIAIDLACYAAVAPNRRGVFRVDSLNFEQTREWPLERIGELKPSRDWSDYIVGVIRQIPKLRGLDLMIYSTVPVGSGLSSSASLEVATAMAAGFDCEETDRLELARLCRRAENDFVGLPSGIMDQYVSVFGQEKAAVKIDCRSLTHEIVRLPEGVMVIAVNSMVKHELESGAYRNRVAECGRAVASIRASRPEVASLRDASLDDLALIPEETAYRRARHVLTENRRVEAFVAACGTGDITEMGRLFLESHRSMQYDYQISCGELDYLVEAAAATEGVWGARMTGGGFGGCTVNLVHPDYAAHFETQIRAGYSARFGKDPVFYRVRAGQGAARIS